MGRQQYQQAGPQKTIIMETGANQVSGGTDEYGWVSGDPSGLAASGAVLIVFDLGPYWDLLNILSLSVVVNGPTTGVNLAASARDDATATLNTARRLGFAFAGTNSLFSVTGLAPGSMNYVLRPQGRYVQLSFSNPDAANACGIGTKVTLTASAN